MRFSRLRLLGFKSFVEPAEFVIERGLTGVVGPNGCGKSNLVEALRWVMGESSYKNMRASGMDDVIFSGSGTRPARNTAEVTLFLDNADRSAPPAFNNDDELQVSRRIEREAGSVYRINGKEARAKDVQLLFADQSTGARSPSMVGQGRIGELIQAKPQARRALLEEAAGISGLHTRRHEAEMRLRGAEQNLERLDDVTGELSVQIENLKRQARQAIRFRSLSADIRKAEAILLHLKWTQAKAQAAEEQSALNLATNQVAARAAAQMDSAKTQAIGAQALPHLREAANAAAAMAQRLTVSRVQIDEEAARMRARRSELDKRLEQLVADLARETAMHGDNAAMLDRLGAEQAFLEADEAGASDQQARAEAALDRTVKALATAEADFAALTARRANAAATRIQAERELRQAEERHERLDRQARDVTRELEALSARLATLPSLHDKRGAVDLAAATLAQANAAQADAEKAAAEARTRELSARIPFSEARAALARVETEARTLKTVLGAGFTADFPAVVDQINVARGYEAALGAALGEDLDLPLDEQAPAHWAAVAPHPDDPLLPAEVPALAIHVEAPARLARRLAQIGLVDESDGARLQAHLAPGQQLVSRTGALWRWDGFRASADAPTPAAQRLAQKNRLDELGREADQTAGLLAQAEKAARDAEAAVKQAADAERAAREERHRAQQHADQARGVLAAAEKATVELETRRAALHDAKGRLKEQREEAQAAITDAKKALADAPDLASLEADDRAAAEAVSAQRNRHAEQRAALDGFRRERDLRARRLAAIQMEREGWIRRGLDAEKQRTALDARLAEAQAEHRTLSNKPEDLEARRRMLLNELAAADDAYKAAADALQAAENRQRDLDRAATAAITALSEAREARGRTEERLTAADDRRMEVERRITETLNVAPHLALRQAGVAAGETLPDAAALEDRIERLKTERERLGAVNLRAEDEQLELASRLTTIVSERDDVIKAIGTLRQAIQGLNREGRDRLLAAFDVVNGQFQRLFTHLFGGGTAELQLIESEDPLEAGLEIMARPPGKRPQTMSLLSGGEQALTAMALIFAVFLTNPAPICVLDEVDAPLDDHNVERFCNLMDEMAAATETRFVIITHNPITMARMNRLFGVTMVEQGVSQLVSVDLQTAEQLRDAG